MSLNADFFFCENRTIHPMTRNSHDYDDREKKKEKGREGGGGYNPNWNI